MHRYLILSAILFASLSPSALALEDPFLEARAVWPEGMTREMNLTVAFRAVIDRERGPVILRVAGASIYRITVNGRFAGHGPARGPTGTIA